MGTIAHFRYCDGTFPGGLHAVFNEPEFDPDMVGWHCWYYGKTAEEFETMFQWLKDSMTGEYEAIQRFNSGNPIITIHIKDEADAAVFKLRWL